MKSKNNQIIQLINVNNYEINLNSYNIIFTCMCKGPDLFASPYHPSLMMSKASKSDHLAVL